MPADGARLPLREIQASRNVSSAHDRAQPGGIQKTVAAAPVQRRAGVDNLSDAHKGRIRGGSRTESPNRPKSSRHRQDIAKQAAAKQAAAATASKKAERRSAQQPWSSEEQIMELLRLVGNAAGAKTLGWDNPGCVHTAVHTVVCSPCWLAMYTGTEKSYRNEHKKGGRHKEQMKVTGAATEGADCEVGEHLGTGWQMFDAVYENLFHQNPVDPDWQQKQGLVVKSGSTDEEGVLYVLNCSELFHSSAAPCYHPLL